MATTTRTVEGGRRMIQIDLESINRLLEFAKEGNEVHIEFEPDKIEILMKRGYIREFISIDASEWNNRLPDDNYKMLQDLLIKTYQKIVIKLKYYNKI